MAIYLSLFLFVLILGAGVAAAVFAGQVQKKRQRNLAIIGSGIGKTLVEEGRDKANARQRADIARKLKEASQEREKEKKDKDKTTVREMLVQAGYEAPVSRFWIFSLVFGVVFFILLKLLTSWPPIAILLTALAAFFLVPRKFLKWKAARRQKQFLEEFSDALDASVRLLQAGMPITEAISMVSKEYIGPLREEMQRIYDNQKIGVPLGQAALQTAKRIPLPEVHMFATALQIQSETGSSLSEVLSNLSTVIRARFRLKRKIKALSSEAKASAAIIACLPILVSLGLYAVNPKYISILFDVTMGRILLGGAIFWMTCGILVMRTMINFKI